MASVPFQELPLIFGTDFHILARQRIRPQIFFIFFIVFNALLINAIKNIFIIISTLARSLSLPWHTF
jgi:hypothetical protein